MTTVLETALETERRRREGLPDVDAPRIHPIPNPRRWLAARSLPIRVLILVALGLLVVTAIVFIALLGLTAAIAFGMIWLVFAAVAALGMLVRWT